MTGSDNRQSITKFGIRIFFLLYELSGLIWLTSVGNNWCKVTKFSANRYLEATGAGRSSKPTDSRGDHSRHSLASFDDTAVHLLCVACARVISDQAAHRDVTIWS